MRRAATVLLTCCACVLARSADGGGSSSPARDAFARKAWEACAKRAAEQGYQVRSLVSARPQRNGDVEIALTVKTRRGTATLRCRYDADRRQVYLDEDSQDDKSWWWWLGD
jgi:hypothetical protein